MSKARRKEQAAIERHHWDSSHHTPLPNNLHIIGRRGKTFDYLDFVARHSEYPGEQQDASRELTARAHLITDRIGLALAGFAVGAIVAGGAHVHAASSEASHEPAPASPGVEEVHTPPQYQAEISQLPFEQQPR